MVKHVAREMHEKVVDKSTGEVIDRRSYSVVRVQQEEVYAKVYQEGIKEHRFTKAEFHVFIALCWKVDYDGIVKLVPSDRDRMGLKRSTWSRGIKRLIDAHWVIRLNKYEYLVSPHVIAKGKWDCIRILRAQWAVAASNNYEIKAVDLVQTHPNMRFDQYKAKPTKKSDDV